MGNENSIDLAAVFADFLVTRFTQR